MRAKIKANYHWVIAAVVLLEMTIYGSVLNNAGLFTIPVTQSLGISRGVYSLASSLSSIVSFVSVFFSGYYFRRFGYKKCLIVSLLIVMLSMLLRSVSYSLLPLCISFALLGTGRGSCFSNGSSYIVGNWFHKHYGLVMGIVTAATGLGGGLGSLVLSRVITNYGWRTAYRVNAALLLGIAVIAFLLIRNHPSDIELQPLGEGAPKHKRKKPLHNHWEGFTVEETKKKPSFYLLLFVIFIASLCAYIGSSAMVSYFQDCGMSLTQAASIKSIMMFTMAGAKLLLGWLSDRIRAKKIALLTSVATVLSLLLLSAPSVTTAYLASITLSLAAPIHSIVITLLIPDLFGSRTSKSGLGFFMSLVPLASMLSSLLLNTMHDYLGSYRPVYMVTSIVATGIIFLYLLLFGWTKADRKKYEAQSQAQ